jgi:metal-responsive CopG/Arc/MetJ family transcriptional regulator
MSTEMVRLNITLPLSITKELNQFSGPRKRSQFIAEAIKLRGLVLTSPSETKRYK